MPRTARLLFLFCLPILSGCGAEPPRREELGRIVFSAAEVPGAEEAYSLPEYLRETAPKPDSAEHTHTHTPGD